MPNWLTFIIAAFAVYRAAYMVAEEEGPFEVFARLRGAIDPDQTTWIGRGVNCVFCTSFWLSLVGAVVLVVAAGFDLWLWPLWWFGIAGAVLVMHRGTEK